MFLWFSYGFPNKSPVKREKSQHVFICVRSVSDLRKLREEMDWQMKKRKREAIAGRLPGSQEAMGFPHGKTIGKP